MGNKIATNHVIPESQERKIFNREWAGPGIDIQLYTQIYVLYK